jgi:uncharacterized protein (DUF2147 family)
MRLPLRAFVAAGVAWLCLGVPGHAWAVEGDVTGLWLDESKAGGIQVEPCGDKMCGRLVWMLHPLNDKGQPKIDTKNPDAKLKSRPFCGMTLMGGFVKSGPGEWEDGWVYNPDDGETYQAHFELQKDGTLHFRGFVGISLLGKTQTWTRPPEALPPCTPPS